MFVSQALADILISIHAPREGSDMDQRGAIVETFQISIHAPREGSDHRPPPPRSIPSAISIHAPREGSDLLREVYEIAPVEFLSTLPARGATTLL